MNYSFGKTVRRNKEVMKNGRRIKRIYKQNKKEYHNLNLSLDCRKTEFKLFQDSFDKPKGGTIELIFSYKINRSLLHFFSPYISKTLTIVFKRHLVCLKAFVWPSEVGQGHSVFFAVSHRATIWFGWMCDIVSQGREAGITWAQPWMEAATYYVIRMLISRALYFL